LRNAQTGTKPLNGHRPKNREASDWDDDRNALKQRASGREELTLSGAPRDRWLKKQQNGGPSNGWRPATA
jgi:hypothetical protein